MSDEMQMTIDEAAHIWCMSLCECSGYDSKYAENFWNRLTLSQGVYSEFVYYMLHQDFACEYKVLDATIVDIMIWQIDHFKASLDMDRQQRKNPDLMLLTAFITMLDMEDDPTGLGAALKSDTGTDYPGKF